MLSYAMCALSQACYSTGRKRRRLFSAPHALERSPKSGEARELRGGWDREVGKKVMGLGSEAALPHYNRPTVEGARRAVGWTTAGPQIAAGMAPEPKKNVRS